jgi:hypothetical protein
VVRVASVQLRAYLLLLVQRTPLLSVLVVMVVMVKALLHLVIIRFSLLLLQLVGDMEVIPMALHMLVRLAVLVAAALVSQQTQVEPLLL